MTTPAEPLPAGIDLSRRPNPTLVKEVGPAGGPTYEHRGAIINCQPGGHICRLLLPGCPLHGHTFGGPGTIPYLVDLWLDHERLPPWITHAEPAPGFREP